MTSQSPGATGGLIGATFGTCRIVAKLGEGGMGEVYRAHDSTLRRDVAPGSEGGVPRSVFVRPSPDVNGGLWQVSSGGDTVWARDGRELFYLDAANRLTVVTVDTSGAGFQHGAPVTLLSTSYVGGPGAYDVSPDGMRFLVIKEDPAARRPNTPIVPISNLVELLRARP